MKKAGLVALGLAVAIWSHATGAQKSVPTSRLPFSLAREAGNTLYLSGQIARTADGTEVRESVSAETHQIMKNIGAVLEAKGYSFDDVVRATVFLRDIEDYHEMNEVYASYFNKEFPARAFIGGGEIVFGLNVEISCIAHKE